MNPTILIDTTYFEPLLARGAVAPFFELKNYDNMSNISYRAKSQCFTNKILNTIIDGEILSTDTKMFCYINPYSSISLTIINRLKYLTLEYELVEPKETDKPISEAKTTNIFNSLTTNVRKNELALLKNESFDIKQLLDFKKIFFDQLDQLRFTYCSLNFKSNFSDNFHFTKLIKNKINLKNNEQKDNIEFKTLALLKRICEDKIEISASLIYIYLPDMPIDKIIRAINDNFFKFAVGIKDNTFFPTEIQVQIASYVTADIAKELEKHLPYKNYFDSDAYYSKLIDTKLFFYPNHLNIAEHHAVHTIGELNNDVVGTTF